MAITNHMWDHTISDWSGGAFYEKQDFLHINQIREELNRANKSNSDIKFLFGCEAEYSFKHRRPAITPEVAEQMEIILAPNSHTHITMPRSFYKSHRKHILYMIDAFNDIVHSDMAKYITAIPHPFIAVSCPYDNHQLLNEITDDEFKSCFDAAAAKNIALEINPNFLKHKTLSQMYDDPIFRMYRIGKECGCKFTVGSDSHDSSGFDTFPLIYVMITLLDLKKNDFIDLTR